MQVIQNGCSYTAIELQLLYVASMSNTPLDVRDSWKLNNTKLFVVITLCNDAFDASSPSGESNGESFHLHVDLQVLPYLNDILSVRAGESFHPEFHFSRVKSKFRC